MSACNSSGPGLYTDHFPGIVEFLNGADKLNNSIELSPNSISTPQVTANNQPFALFTIEVCLLLLFALPQQMGSASNPPSPFFLFLEAINPNCWFVIV